MQFQPHWHAPNRMNSSHTKKVDYSLEIIYLWFFVVVVVRCSVRTFALFSVDAPKRNLIRSYLITLFPFAATCGDLCVCSCNRYRHRQTSVQIFRSGKQ